MCQRSPSGLGRTRTAVDRRRTCWILPKTLKREDGSNKPLAAEPTPLARPRRHFGRKTPPLQMILGAVRFPTRLRSSKASWKL
jgi:hypothetical protein